MPAFMTTSASSLGVIPSSAERRSPAPLAATTSAEIQTAIDRIRSCPANAPAQPRRAHALVTSTPHLPPAGGCRGLFGGIETNARSPAVYTCRVESQYCARHLSRLKEQP